MNDCDEANASLISDKIEADLKQAIRRAPKILSAWRKKETELKEVRLKPVTWLVLLTSDEYVLLNRPLLILHRILSQVTWSSTTRRRACLDRYRQPS